MATITQQSVIGFDELCYRVIGSKVEISSRNMKGQALIYKLEGKDPEVVIHEHLEHILKTFNLQSRIVVAQSEPKPYPDLSEEELDKYDAMILAHYKDPVNNPLPSLPWLG